MISRNSIGDAYPVKYLGEIVEFLDSKRRPVTESDRRAGPYPYYGANGQQGTIDDYIFDEPLVLLAEDGGHFETPERGIAYRISGKTWVNNHAHVLRPKDGIHLPFLCRVLENYDVTPFITGTTRGKLTKAGASEIVIPVPPLADQQRIADILDRAEALRAKRRAALAQLDELTEAIFMDMFGDPVINPMGWNTKKLEKLCVKILGGGTPSKSRPEYYEGNIPWVTPKDMKQDYIQDSIDHISAQAVEESSTKLIPPNSLLMVIRSGILKKKLPVAINTCEVTINQDMKGFIFDNKLTNSYFMLYFFKIYQRDLLNRVRSVTADNLEFNQIKDINVILPPIDSQQKFVKIVEHLERVRYSQEKSLLEINNLFDSLSHEAFTGKLFSHQFFEQEIENGVKI